MRSVDRSGVPPPNSLNLPSASVAAERTAAQDYYSKPHQGNERRPAYKFKQYRSDDVQQALATLFDNKCAYCESPMAAVGARQVEHYRPKGQVDGEPDHPGYWWLALEWENLLPTCIDCNTRKRQVIVVSEMTDEELEAALSRRAKPVHGKGITFPISPHGIRAGCAADDHDAEEPLLLDPCNSKKDPEKELSWPTGGRWSIVTPSPAPAGASPYGEATVRICALNRSGLVRARTALLQELKVQRQEILDDIASAKANPAAAPILIEQARKRAAAMKRFYAKDQPYTALARVFVKAFELEMRDLLKAL